MSTHVGNMLVVSVYDEGRTKTELVMIHNLTKIIVYFFAFFQALARPEAVEDSEIPTEDDICPPEKFGLVRIYDLLKKKCQK